MNKMLDLVGRAYMYFKLGYTNYIALLLGLPAYFVIIYNYILYRYLPETGIATFGVLAISIVVISMAIGIIMKRSGFWGREHQISTEANPTLDYPIGKKEMLGYDATITGHESSLLGYDASILGYETTIMMLHNQIEMNKALGIPIEALEESIERQVKMLAHIKNMQAKVRVIYESLIAMRAQGKVV